MALSTDSRFFGLDLTQLRADITNTWRKTPQWPALSWLRPEQLLTLVPAQGEPSAVWESGAAAADAKRVPAFWAIELPEGMVLRKDMLLPPLTPADCASAAQLEVQAISPFGSAELLWGYTELSRSDKAVKLHMVLASRTQVEPYLQDRIAQRQQVQGGMSLAQPEIWAFAPGRLPVVFQGFGEYARAAAGRKKLWLNIGAALLALLLVMGIAITPTAQLRLRAIEAVKAYDAMHAKTTDIVAKREQLMQSADQVAALSAMLAERVDSVKLLSMLTRVLPDDTALQSARVQGTKVTITGLTSNASALMQKLSSQEGIKDVKAPSAATRMQGVNKESFTIELALDTKTFGPDLKMEAPPPSLPSPPASGTANERTAPAPASASASEPVPAAAASPATVPAPVSRQSGGDAPTGKSAKHATVGGTKSKASVGGSATKPAQPQEGKQ